MPSNVKSKDGSQGKTKRKKRTKSSREHSQDGSEGDLELDRELYPIGHYLSDRAEMVEQMFSILKKDKIQSMLPPILKEIQWPDLKAHCLEQLNSMSEKQIIRILGGKPYAPEQENDESEKAQNVDLVLSSSSSSSSTSSCGELSSSSSSQNCSDSEPEAEPKQEPEVKKSATQPVSVKPDPNKVEDDPDMLQIGLSPKEMGDLLGDDEDLQKKEKEESINVGLEKREKEICTAVGKTLKDEKSVDAACGKKSEPKGGKTLLEILELEMRARAIRALLKQSQSTRQHEPKPGSSSSNKKANSSDDKSNTEVSENSKQTLVKSQTSVPVIVKVEVLSDEDDVVFVNESQSNSLPPKESSKTVKQKECLSAVYDVSTDILKFKPTVMSTTSKVSVVDTSGNPIILPKVKSQTKVKTLNPTVIVIDNDGNDYASSSKSASKDPKSVVSKESSILKRGANLIVEVKTMESSKRSADSDKCKTKLTRIVTNKVSDSNSPSPVKETSCKNLQTQNQGGETERDGTAKPNNLDTRKGINKANGKKIKLDMEHAGT